MREIRTSEAKTHLLQLLDQVERGETLVISRQGRAIARLIPEPRQPQVIKAIRDRAGKLSLDEILSARHEGHKY